MLAFADGLARCMFLSSKFEVLWQHVELEAAKIDILAGVGWSVLVGVYSALTRRRRLLGLLFVRGDHLLRDV
jgi:hypothetical protein